MNISKTTLRSAVLGALPLFLGAADGVQGDVGPEEHARSKTRSDELRGLNGLVAAPAMGDAQGLPLRLMSVGVDDRGKVFVTETVRQMREDISLLQSKFLHEADMALTTVEQKEKWIQGFSKRSAEELVNLLAHEDRRLRAAAQDELAARKATDLFQRVALDEKAAQLARIHGLWGLTQLKRWDSEVAERFSQSPDDELQAQLARYVGDIGSGPEAQKWAATLLGHRSPRVKMFAAISCGRLRATPVTSGLLAMIQDAANAIPVLREAGVVGLMGAASPAELEKLFLDPSEAVRIAAVVALRRLGAVQELISFLDDSSPQVMSDAVLAIYDEADAQTFEKHPQALASIAQKLAPTSPAPINMRALAANRRLGTREAVSRITAFLTDLNHERQSERITAIDMLASWFVKTTLDPLDGRYFPVPAFSSDNLAAELAPHIMALASDSQTEIAERAIALSAVMKASEETVARAAAAVLDDSLAMPPTLQGVARRLTREELLESILDPGAKVAPGYGIQVLTLNDGNTATGTQMSETNEAIVLKSPDGKLSTYPKTHIKSATKPIGAMPPMKSLLTIREMRDLVAFLSTTEGVVD